LKALERNHPSRTLQLWLAIVVSAFACVLLSACAKRGAALAITHVTVVDGTGAPAQPDMTVLIERGRITAVTPSSSANIPWRTPLLDAREKYLIPGLADMHVHLTAAGEPGGSREFMIPLLLAYGITSVRDMGGYLESLLPLRREIETETRLGPRIYLAGPYLDGDPPSFQPSLVVTNATQAAQDVHDLLRRGVDFIKVQSMLPRDVYFAIAAICKQEHVLFAGHVPDRVTAAEASAAGQRSIEHLTGVLRGCSTDEPKLMQEQFLPAAGKEKGLSSNTRQFDWDRELWMSFSEARAHVLLAEFVANGTWQTPTLILLQQDAYPSGNANLLADARMKYVPGIVLARWKKAAEQNVADLKPRDVPVRAGLMRNSEHIVDEMQSAGVKLLAGTDAPAPFVYPGFGLHDELGLLVEAGLTPMQALQAATARAAEFMGKSATQGTIEKGKVADLVLLDGDPLANIHNTARISAVVLRGKLLDRAALDALLSSAEKFAAAH
jgi:imidazolonepropionase-like amidohydrolase